MKPCADSLASRPGRPPAILVATAELSASDAAAVLGPALRALDPRVLLFALGSEALATAGYAVLADPTGTASVGLWESFATARARRRHLARARRLLRDLAPDLVICIDSPAFNIPLARQARRLGIPVAWFIPPQEYLWGKTGLARTIAAGAALVGCVDEAGHKLYARLGAKTLLTGHPLAGSPARRRKPGHDRGTGPVIALFPGSRRQEIRRIAPALLAAAARLAAARPGTRFILPLAAEGYRAPLTRLADRLGLSLDLVPREAARPLLARADLAITKAGTTTLDAALAGCPLVVLYRIHPLTYRIATRILRIQNHLPGISLPNICLGERLVPELIQKEMTPEAIARTALEVLADPEPQRAGLARAVRAFSRPDAARVFARAALDLLPGALRKR